MAIEPVLGFEDSADDFTGEQLALPTSERVCAAINGRQVWGGRLRNGVQTFLSTWKRFSTRIEHSDSACFG